MPDPNGMLPSSNARQNISTTQLFCGPAEENQIQVLHKLTQIVFLAFHGLVVVASSNEEADKSVYSNVGATISGTYLQIW